MILADVTLAERRPQMAAGRKKKKKKEKTRPDLGMKDDVFFSYSTTQLFIIGPTQEDL